MDQAASSGQSVSWPRLHWPVMDFLVKSFIFSYRNSAFIMIMIAGRLLYYEMFLFRPSLTNHDGDGSLEMGWIHPEEDEYSMAYRKGLEMTGSSCSNYFASLCPFSFVKLLDL